MLARFHIIRILKFEIKNIILILIMQIYVINKCGKIKCILEDIKKTNENSSTR